MPLVSVIIPTYNSSGYIIETINTILNQTLQDFEIVVVDDHSTDNTIDILNSIKDPRIKIFANEVNRGIPYTHNKLIELCSTNFIAIQDHDDLSYPYRLERQFNYLKQHPESLAVASYPTYINHKGESINQPFIRNILRRLKLNNAAANGNEAFASMLFKNIFCHSTIMLNKSNLDNINYQNEFSICDDYDLMCRITERSAVEIDHKPVLKYRVHTTNTSSKRYLERENDVNTIQTRYLNQLGIDPTKEQLFIHNGFFNNIAKFKPSINYLRETLDWYQLILNKNRFKLIYEEKALKKAIELNWFERCLASKSLGFKMLKVYLESKVGNPISYQRFAKFFILFFAIFLGTRNNI